MTSLTTKSVLIRSDGIVSREIEGELLIVPIASRIGDNEDEIYTLNETGREIWQLIDGNRSVIDIVSELKKSYAGSVEDIIKEVLGIAGELVSRKILVIKSS
jgi:hypothetical protein